MRGFLFLTNGFACPDLFCKLFQSLDEGFFISNKIMNILTRLMQKDLGFSPLMRDFLFLTKSCKRK